MNDSIILSRLRGFLLVFAGIILAGALVELIFSGHYEEPLQLIPFVLCGLGLLAISLALLSTRRKSVRFLRISMGLVLLGSIIGTFIHITNNALFEMEIHPGLNLFQKVAAGLGGANPLLAPGILGIAAVLALAAVYGQPAHEHQPGT
jgi:ABC-type transport system involved in multi-copper enzyme maturation permease subunit